MNTLKETLVRHKRIIPVLVAIVAIAAYMIPAHLASAVVSNSGNVQQAVTQSNSISALNSGKYGGAFADFNTLTNAATNTANVAISNLGGGVSGSGNVLQTIDQANSVTATNTGDFGAASASNNLLTNTATNTANVAISNQGGSYHGSSHHGGSSKGVSNSGNVAQAIDQSNSVSATNTGASGVAVADHNTLTNTATNTANVAISNQGSSHHGSSHHGSSHHDSKGVSDSGNVAQAIKQSNSVSASNSGDNGVASASGNSLSNSASNSASVDISNSNSNHNNDKKH